MPITDPTGISGCKVWYKQGDWYKDAGVTPASATGDQIQQWNDSSGNGLHGVQTTASQRPTLQLNASGTTSAARFTAASLQELVVNWSWAANSPITLVVVAQRLSAPGVYGVVGTHQWSGGNSGLFFGWIGNTQVFLQAGSGGGSSALPGFAAGEPLAWWLGRMGGPRSIERNETNIESDTDTQQCTSLSNATDSRIGSGTGHFYDGYIYTVIGYNKLLSSAEAADLYAWLHTQGYDYPLPLTNDRVTAGFLSAGQTIAAPHPTDRVTAGFLSAGQAIAAPGAPPINDRVTAGFVSAGQTIAAPVPVDNDRVTAGWLSAGQVIPVPVVGKPYSYAFIIQ